MTVKKMRMRCVAALAAMLTLSACATSSANHAILLPPTPPPKEAKTDAPRLLIGIEKFRAPLGPDRLAYNSEAGGPGCTAANQAECINLQKGAFPEIVKKFWSQRFNDRTQQLVSHVVELKTDGACESVLYSIYDSTACGEALKTPNISAHESWKLLSDEKELRSRIDQRITKDGITHIIVLTTGWTVRQPNTIISTTKWINGLDDSIDDDRFKPLYILLTWPAQRSDGYLSFLNKSHDADEVGLTWANVFINRTLAGLPSRDKVGVVLIGHSFGAKLLSTATFTGETIGAPRCAGPDLLVGLQAAFSNGRYLGSRGDRDGDAYKVGGDCKTKAAYTTSKHDTGIQLAPTQLFGTSRYMGGGSTYARLKTNTDVLEENDSRRDRVLIINGDQAICGHGDVAGAWTSRQIAQLIKDHASKGVDLKLASAVERPGCK